MLIEASPVLACSFRGEAEPSPRPGQRRGAVTCWAVYGVWVGLEEINEWWVITSCDPTAAGQEGCRCLQRPVARWGLAPVWVDVWPGKGRRGPAEVWGCPQLLFCSLKAIRMPLCVYLRRRGVTEMR